MKHRKNVVVLLVVGATSGAIYTVVALSGSDQASAAAAPAAAPTIKAATMTLSGASIPTDSPLGKPLKISAANFGDQQGPSGVGGGAGPIEFSPLVVSLPGGGEQAQLGGVYGQQLTVTIDLPAGRTGKYIEYAFSNAALSSTQTRFAGGQPTSTSTVKFTFSGERVTVH